MNIEDHIFALVAKKLANEASDDELYELSRLLPQYPNVRNNIKLITEWWDRDDEKRVETNSILRFQNILEQLKNNRFEE